MIKLKKIPEVGQYYHFWDDGKISVSRHYICRVESIISIEKAKAINITDDKTLYDFWKKEKTNSGWLYNDNTDYFVEVSCPKYDPHNLWFVRSKDGGWFSMDIESFWQAGRLDVDNEIFNNVINEVKNYTNVSKESIDNIISQYGSEKY